MSLLSSVATATRYGVMTNYTLIISELMLAMVCYLVANLVPRSFSISDSVL